jgi:hypothetical protein
MTAAAFDEIVYVMLIVNVGGETRDGGQEKDLCLGTFIANNIWLVSLRREFP